MITSSNLIGIGITTKDRWDDLEITLARLREEGLDRMETVVIDDGSVVPRPAVFERRFPWVRFIRVESSQGYIAQRNRLANLLSAPMMLSLDDDSFPIAGNLEAATKWLSEHPKVVALGFRVLFRNQPIPSDFASQKPFPLRDYIGCAHLIKRDIFLALGGYEERLEFFMEEGEFCLRAIQQGYEIHAYPAVVVQHNVTPVARNKKSRSRLFLRNEILLALWYFPIPECYLRATRVLPMVLIKHPSMRKQARSLLTGYIQAPIHYLTWPKKRKRLTLHQFREWKKLPMAARVLEG